MVRVNKLLQSEYSLLDEDIGHCERSSFGTMEEYKNKNCLCMGKWVASGWEKNVVALEIKEGLLLLVFNILEKDVRTDFEEWICPAHAVNDLKLLSNTDGT
jgi:hypothetical protein